MTEKWPRQYAGEIVKMDSRDERREALLIVPEEFREWVKRLVEIGWRHR